MVIALCLKRNQIPALIATGGGINRRGVYMGAPYSAGDVNQVLRTVVALSKDGDTQLSILAQALVGACISCQINRQVLIDQINEMFDNPGVLIPLPPAN